MRSSSEDDSASETDSGSSSLADSNPLTTSQEASDDEGVAPASLPVPLQIGLQAPHSATVASSSMAASSEPYHPLAFTALGGTMGLLHSRGRTGPTRLAGAVRRPHRTRSRQPAYRPSMPPNGHPAGGSGCFPPSAVGSSSANVLDRSQHGKSRSPSEKKTKGSVAQKATNREWSHAWTEFDPLPSDFSGPTPGFTKVVHKVTDGVAYFNDVWSLKVLARIVRETNCYVEEVPAGRNRTRGGQYWSDLNVPKLKTYLGLCLLMGIKKNPNVKSYWSTSMPFL